MKKSIAYIALIITSLILTACGSSGGGTPQVTTTAFISKGPVTGATCQLFAVNNGVAATASLATKISNQGSVDFGGVNYSGTALISCVGGTYTDEATGATDVAASNMNAVVSMTAGGNYVISPLTELGFRLAAADLETAITTHNENVAEQFGLSGVDITTQQPTDLNTEAADDDNAGTYGSALAAISQLIENGSEGDNLDAVLDSLTSDLSDGDGALDTATQNNLAGAVNDFVSGGSDAAENNNTDTTDDIIAGLLAAPALSNASTQDFIFNTEITSLTMSNTGGAVLSACSASPNLPAGLNLAVTTDQVSCEISGTPTAAQGSVTYSITATNVTGNSTADVNIEVAKADQLALNSGSDLTKVYADGNFSQLAIGGSGTGATNYTSSNSSVATVTSSGEISIISVGVVEITATNSGDANYNTIQDSYQLTIDKKAVTATANAQSRIYGTSDPALTYSIAPALKAGDSLAGSLTRTVGNNVGHYPISGSLTNTNYNVTFVGANLSITARSITVTADTKAKVYGENDPALTYSVAPALIAGDSLTGSLTRVVGDNVGSYAISAPLTNANYVVTSVGANLTITTKPITVTADVKTKVYGEGDPTLTYSVSPALIASDSLAGTLARVAGNDVGSYAISTPLTNANYAVTSVSANLTITAKPITVTAGAKAKVYGENDPTLTYSVAPALIADDSLTGSLTRAVGDNVGSYAISAPLTNANYAVTSVGANLTITAKPITVTTDAKTKVYGENDPTLTYSVAPALITGDNLTGSLTRAVGDIVGSYAISAPLTNANYAVTTVSANLTITAKAITISANAMSKVYEATDPLLFTYNIAPSLITGDVLTGSLSRAAGNDAGTYAINQNNLSASANYQLVFVSADFTINPKPITITAIEAEKTYGQVDPTFNFTVTPATVDLADINGALSRTDTSDDVIYDASNDLTGHEITLGNLVAENPNYAISYQEALLIIHPKEIMITATAAEKTASASDPALLWTVSPSLETGDSFTGSLLRDAGEAVGTYEIDISTLSAGSNYQATYTLADFTIRPQAPTNLVATATGGEGVEGNKVAITWDAPAAGGADTFTLYTSTASMVAAQDSNSSNLNIYTPVITSGISGSATEALTGQLGSSPYHFLMTTMTNSIESNTSAIDVSATPYTSASTIADPYIIGAVLYEDFDDSGDYTAGELTSTVTTETGGFTFLGGTLTPGKSIRIKTQGLHEGVTYDVDLEAIVDATGNVEVVTPLTTFISKGLTNQQLADILNHAAQQNIYDNTDGHYISAGTPIQVGGVDWSITAAEIALNPLANDLLNTTITDLQANPRILIKLQASLATYGLLKIFNGSNLSQYDAATLYELGYPNLPPGGQLGLDAVDDGNGHVAVLARNLLKGVTDALKVDNLVQIETGLSQLRGGLVSASSNPANGVPALNPTTAYDIVPEVTLDMVSKIAVSVVDGLATKGLEASNAEITDHDNNGDVTDDKVRASLEAVGIANGAIMPQINTLGSKLYGMKYEGNMSAYKAMLISFGGATSNLIDGMNQSEAGNVTFRFNTNGVITAY